MQVRSCEGTAAPVKRVRLQVWGSSKANLARLLVPIPTDAGKLVGEFVHHLVQRYVETDAEAERWVLAMDDYQIPSSSLMNIIRDGDLLTLTQLEKTAMLPKQIPVRTISSKPMIDSLAAKISTQAKASEEGLDKVSLNRPLERVQTITARSCGETSRKRKRSESSRNGEPSEADTSNSSDSSNCEREGKANPMVDSIHNDVPSELVPGFSPDIPSRKNRTKNGLYLKANQKVRWDGKRWRSICAVKECLVRARGQTGYCNSHQHSAKAQEQKKARRQETQRLQQAAVSLSTSSSSSCSSSSSSSSSDSSESEEDVSPDAHIDVSTTQDANPIKAMGWKNVNILKDPMKSSGGATIQETRNGEQSLSKDKHELNVGKKKDYEVIASVNFSKTKPVKTHIETQVESYDSVAIEDLRVGHRIAYRTAELCMETLQPIESDYTIGCILEIDEESLHLENKVKKSQWRVLKREITQTKLLDFALPEREEVAHPINDNQASLLRYCKERLGEIQNS